MLEHNEGIVLTSPLIYSMLLELDLEQVNLVEQELAAVGLVLVHSAVPEEYLVAVAVNEVAPDKTCIEYWYEKPHKLLQHYARFIFSRETFQEISGVDFTIGGDHGKGRFWMMFKIIIRYSSNKPAVSEIFQVANINYAKDDITVLRDTVLKPIGKALNGIITSNCALLILLTFIFSFVGDSLKNIGN